MTEIPTLDQQITLANPTRLTLPHIPARAEHPMLQMVGDADSDTCLEGSCAVPSRVQRSRSSR